MTDATTTPNGASPAPPKQSRRQRRRQRPSKVTSRRMMPEHLLPDFIPPEGVPLRFTVAGVGARLGAQLTDILITAGFVLGIILLVLLLRVELGDGWSILFSILFLFIRAPYYILTELLWNGQTLGKKITGLRVISATGGSLEAHSVVVRNLMKEMEIFVPGTYLIMAPTLDGLTYVIVLLWIAILLIVPLTNKRRQRMGDMVANTVVIHHPRAVMAPDLTAKVPAHSETAERYPFQSHQLDHYGRYELQTLERVLQAGPPYSGPDAKRRHEQSLQTIMGKILAKIDYPEKVPEADALAFLQAFYKAQRAYLESRRLFGDAREDKFHKEENGKAE